MSVNKSYDMQNGRPNQLCDLVDLMTDDHIKLAFESKLKVR